VDNNSPDDSVMAVRQRFPRARLLALTENGGFARGMNAGLRLATGRAVFMLNADTALRADTLPALCQALLDHPRAGIVGPVQLFPATGGTGLQIASAFRDPTLAREVARLIMFSDSVSSRLGLGAWRVAGGGSPRSVDWLMGAALLVRRECLATLGGFSESQFMYGEDWDLCYRARQAGWQVLLVPASRIIHHENASGRSYFGSARGARVLAATLHYHEKFFGRTSRRALAAVNVAGSLLRMMAVAPGSVLGPRREEWRIAWHAHVGMLRTALRALR
jgi:GT2 family glycosyltransferase